MKKINGGYDEEDPAKKYDAGKCAPGVGMWTYTNPVTSAVCEADFIYNCSSENGACHKVGDTPWT